MKKIILFTFLILLAVLANAQSKRDSIIKKADTTIVPEAEKLNKTKTEISSIQANITVLMQQKEDNQKQIAKLNKSISKLSETKNISKAEIVELDKAKYELKKSLNQDSTILISLNEAIDDAKKKIESLKQDIASVTKEKKSADSTLSQRKADIALQLDSIETVGIIEMLDFTNIHVSKGPPIKAKIEEVRVNVVQGIILEIIVKTNQGIFRNKGKANQEGMVIADLLHFGTFIDKKLKIEPNSKLNSLDENDKSSAYILLKDVILYTPISSYTNAVYGEFEIALFPTPDKRFYLIKESTSINTYFNVAAFTDIKGISGEANGVAQFTADAKFMLNTRSIPKTSMVYANYISFQGGLSKFDSEFKGTEFIADTVNRKNLFQRANYKVGVKLNLLKGYLPPNPILLYNTFELNVGYNVIGSQIFKITKTTYQNPEKTISDTTFRTVTQNQWYAEPTITFSRRKNFSMCLALPCFINNIKKSAGIKNDQTEYWVVPSISLMYFGKRDVGSKIFFRYNHYINVEDKTQAFSQMQLGYSLNLTQVLKK